MMKKRFNIKGELVLCTYHWPNTMKEFSSGSAPKEWKDDQEIIHNTYHGGNIETDHHFICSIPEGVAKNFLFHNLTTPFSGILREVLDNDIATRDKIYLNGLVTKKGKSGDV